MSYADDTEYASKSLIELITHEENELGNLKNFLDVERRKFEVNKRDFESSDLNDDFSEAYVMNAYGRMAKAYSESEKLELKVSRIETAIGARQVAVQSLCGALLQISKQGISLVHEKLANAPEGRQLSGITLKEIIWQARNQAFHFEEQSFQPPVISLFKKLEQAFGPEFSLSAHLNKSLAKQIVLLLGWSKYETYRDDMKLLGL